MVNVMLLFFEAEAAVTERPAARAATTKTARTRRPRRARMPFTFLLLLHVPHWDPSGSLVVLPPPLLLRSTHARRARRAASARRKSIPGFRSASTGPRP